MVSKSSRSTPGTNFGMITSRNCKESEELGGNDSEVDRFCAIDTEKRAVHHSKCL